MSKLPFSLSFQSMVYIHAHPAMLCSMWINIVVTYIGKNRYNDEKTIGGKKTNVFQKNWK
jgi:hypothetical protein